MIKFRYFVVFCSLYPYCFYSLYFCFGYFSSQETLGETYLSLFAMIGIFIAILLYAVCIIMIIFILFRRKTLKLPLQVVAIFFISNLVWWSAWITDGYYFQELPFQEQRRMPLHPATKNKAPYSCAPKPTGASNSTGSGPAGTCSAMTTGPAS
jgi:hypothetical protein